MNPIAELIRRLDNLLLAGVIAEVDLPHRRARVRAGALVTNWLPWFALRAGAVRRWSPPSVGEQCLVLSPGGEPGAGFVLCGLYSDDFPAPATAATLDRHAYADGAVIEYDHADHVLRAMLPAGGRVEVTAPGGVSLVGDITITGNVAVTGGVTATADVVADGVSLIDHLTTGVTPGTGLSGVPQ